MQRHIIFGLALLMLSGCIENPSGGESEDPQDPPPMVHEPEPEPEPEPVPVLDAGSDSELDMGSVEEDMRVPPPICGNGLVEEGEECDKRPMSAGDGCTRECEFIRYTGPCRHFDQVRTEDEWLQVRTAVYNHTVRGLLDSREYSHQGADRERERFIYNELEQLILIQASREVDEVWVVIGYTAFEYFPEGWIHYILTLNPEDGAIEQRSIHRYADGILVEVQVQDALGNTRMIDLIREETVGTGRIVTTHRHLDNEEPVWEDIPTRTIVEEFAEDGRQLSYSSTFHLEDGTSYQDEWRVYTYDVAGNLVLIEGESIPPLGNPTGHRRSFDYGCQRE